MLRKLSVTALAALALAVTWPGGARAAIIDPAPVLTDKLIVQIIKWANDAQTDLDAAIALAKSANNNVTLPCWTALHDFSGRIKDLPSNLPPLHLATTIEVGTELLMTLQPDSPVVVGCSALSNFQRRSVRQMVTGIITGVAGIARLPFGIP